MAGWVDYVKMHGMIYYYYDKVLVANCNLKNLEPYAGKVGKDYVVQLLVYSLETENAPLSAPVGISADGDFYFAVISGKIIYQIHKDGRLIRAYAADSCWVEKTIMEAPMAVLAMLQGKILLSGTFLSAGDGIYVFLGETEGLNGQGLIREDTVLIEERRKSWRGVPGSYPGHEAAQSLASPWIPKLKGIFAVRREGKKSRIAPMEREEAKELLAENFVGYSLFSQELRQAVRDSESMNRVCGEIPVKVLTLGEDCGASGLDEESILKLISQEQ